LTWLDSSLRHLSEDFLAVAFTSLIIFNFVSKVMTTRGLLASLIDYADMAVDFTVAARKKKNGSVCR
jgi:hypothetical protein